MPYFSEEIECKFIPNLQQILWKFINKLYNELATKFAMKCHIFLRKLNVNLYQTCDKFYEEFVTNFMQIFHKFYDEFVTNSRKNLPQIYDEFATNI